MAYSDFSLTTVQKQFHLTLQEIRDLYAAVPKVVVSDFLQATLDENVPLALAIHTEKARSERASTTLTGLAKFSPCSATS
jgi:hypothetical protein